jgi:hypothetical protein
MNASSTDTDVGEAVRLYYAAQDAARRSPFVTEHALAELANGVARAHGRALEKHEPGSEPHAWHQHEHHFWRCRHLHHAARTRDGARPG